MSNQWGNGSDSSWGTNQSWQSHGFENTQILQQPQNSGEPGWDVDPARNRRKNGVIVASAVILLVAAVTVGAFFYSRMKDNDPIATGAGTSETTSTDEQPATDTNLTVVETVKAAPAAGECDPAAAYDSDRQRINLFCDGQWFLIAQQNSSFMDLYYWTGSEWGYYETDGKLPQSGFKCYDKAKLEQAEAPEGLLAVMEDNDMFCVDSQPTTRSEAESTTQPTTSANDIHSGDWLQYPSCDGSYALIVDSVSVYPGNDPQGPVNQSLANHPGAIGVYPGVCDSLRAYYDGATVYPIYVDYGNDLAGVCAAEARGEGFARKLQSVADFSSPC